MLTLDQPIEIDAGVEPKTAEMLRRVTAADLSVIAAKASGVPEARLLVPLQATDVVSVHADRRTIGIVRVTGMAEAAGRSFGWSTVAKVMDFSVTPETPSLWVRPENEPAVYAGRYFADDGSGFRPARCHLISTPAPGVVVLWLEDLAHARHAPFALDELAQILRNLGRWNGLHFRRELTLPFTPGRDIVALRWDQMRFEEQLREFLDMRDTPALRDMYGSHSIDLPLTLHKLLLAVNARARTHAHTLCFGDCNIGNLFSLPGETVAIDWASLTIDPLGVDAGCVIGSAISWGRQFVDVARSEGELFGCYMAGLGEAGWKGARDDVRRGFMLHFGTYLLSMSMMPASLGRYGRDRVERRMETPWDDLPGRCAGLIDLLPGYIDELARLV